MTCACSEASGLCSRRDPPKKLLFAVNSQMPPATSKVQRRPTGLERPTSGLKDHRLDPRLTRRFGSYCPVGTTAVRLTPTTVFGLWAANSFGLSAGPPIRFVENLSLASPIPERVTS